MSNKSEKKPKITFEESTHTYTNEYGEELISVSSLIHLYSPPFDPYGEIIKRCAASRDTTVEALRQEWDQGNQDACVRGRSFHNQAEYWIKNKKIMDGDYKDVIEQLAQLPFRGKLESEKIVFNNELGIAGTIDLLESFDNRHKKIMDFKTNKKLKFRGFYNRDKGYDMMLYPVSHLENCNWVHYCLQICGYQIIEEQNGSIIDEKELIYINPKSRKLEIYDIPDIRKEFMDIIEHYKLIKNF